MLKNPDNSAEPIIDQAAADRENNQLPARPAGKLAKSQMIMALVLAVFAFIVIIVWLIQLKNTISQPFVYAPAGPEAGLSATDQQIMQSSQDTDGDGLNDWDELNFYGTSPYLEDSDSDGFTDKQEIDSNNDPNCPNDRDCSLSGLLDGDSEVIGNGSGSSSQSGVSLNDLINQLRPAASADLPTAPGDQSGDINELLGGLDAASLRQLLLQYGMKEEILNQISDEQLMSTFEESLKQ
jgi:hypothetical protein